MAFKLKKSNRITPKHKNPSTVKKALNWLKPTSPAKGALLFVIVFAVIGGSYTAHKSFAAGNMLVNYHDKIQNVLGSSTLPDSIGGKGTITVWMLPASASFQAGVGTYFKVVPLANTQFMACVTARLKDASAPKNLKIYMTGGTDYKIGEVTVPGASIYTKICSPSTLSLGPGGSPEKTIYIRAERANLNSTNDVHISNISLEW